MKKGIAVIVLSAAILGVCFTEYFYLRDAFRHIEAEAEAIRAEINLDTEHIDTGKAIAMAENLESYWLKKKSGASVMINHVLVMEYTAILGRLKTNIRINEYPMAQVEADNLLRQTKELQELHTPFIKNIF
jgi:predicted LPLAT superfamily acyltransferase